MAEELIDILPEGSSQDAGYAGGFTGNVWQHHGTWEIRPGFGQLDQMDSGLGLPPADMVTAYGYENILGTHIFKTDFGHTQILTVIRTKACTGNISEVNGRWGYYFAVVIYDVTTGEKWEEILHTHTSKGRSAAWVETADALVDELTYRKGVYETNRSQDTQAWILAPDTTGMFFCQYQGNVYFGNDKCGLWAYLPCDFAGNRWRRPQVDGIRDIHASLPYSESTCIVQVVPSNGIFEDGFSYLSAGSFPVPVAAAVLENRLALAQGRDIFFTDVGRPGSIIGTNVVSVPSQETITALGAQNGVLYIFTANETWVYRPNVGAVISGGQLIQVSSSVGCISPQAVTKAAGLLVWASRAGVWSAAGLEDPKDIALAIGPLFDRGLPLPLSSYYQNSGITTVSGDQPRPTLRWTGLDRVTVTYESQYGLLLVSLPGQNAVLCLQDGMWSVWSTETMVNASQTTVVTTANIKAGIALAMDSQVYLVGGIETYTPDDQSRADPPENAPSRSVYITKWGRGGGLDRSVESFEDSRRVAGWYEESTLNPRTSIDGGYLVIGEPYVLPTGTLLDRVTSGSPAGAVLYPVYLRPEVTTVAPDRLQIRVRFDNSNWTPILANEGTADIALQFPPERARSRFGWGLTYVDTGSVPVAGTAEAQVYDTGTGLVAASGNEMRLYFDGTTGTAIQSWTYTPYLNVNQRWVNPLFWIPMRRKVGTNVETMSAGFDVQVCQMRSSGVTYQLSSYWWHYADPRYLHAADDVAQAVDWAVKSPQLNLGSNGQARLRGAYLRVLSHGRTSSPLRPWPRGLLNYTAGSEHREWSSHVGDYNPDYPGNLKVDPFDPLWERLLDPPSAEATFNNVATWGDTAVGAAGNILVTDPQVDEVAVSDSVKGDTASVMVFGHVRGRDETIAIHKAQAPVRGAGSRRKTGRSE